MISAGCIYPVIKVGQIPAAVVSALAFSSVICYNVYDNDQ